MSFVNICICYILLLRFINFFNNNIKYIQLNLINNKKIPKLFYYYYILALIKIDFCYRYLNCINLILHCRYYINNNKKYI